MSALEAATPQRQQPKGTDHGTISREEVSTRSIFCFWQREISKSDIHSPNPPEPGSVSFAEMIRQLEHEKQDLAVDLDSARAQSEDLLCKDREWQEKTCCLQEELQGCQSSIDQLERELERGSRGIIAAITALQSSQSSKEDKSSLQME
ncbi:hypothetical protein HAV15_010629 [Penicillium sp. str. |nr:hypothetical protein HAV15_010629 [Penicillium sp. str. \